MIAPPAGLTEDDFEAIEAAVMETERGRWFLQEFARRCRAEASGEVLTALARLEARAAEREVKEAEARREAANTAAALAATLQKLHAFALDLTGPVELPPPAPPPALTHRPAEPAAAGGLDRRLSALQALDELDVAEKLKLFG